MRARKDPLRVLQAIYSFECDESTWMRGIVEAALPYGLGSGVIGYVISLGDKLAVRSVTLVGCDLYDAAVVERISSAIGKTMPAVLRHIHAPSRLRRSERVVTDAARRTRTPLARIVAVLRKIGLATPTGWGVIGGDAAHESALLCVPVTGREAPTASDRRALDMLGAHLGAALRLRALAETPSADAPSTAAVFAPDGRVLDARGDESRRELPRLIDAVRRSERARTRKAEHLEGLSLWTALTDGRWSIVETVERDGKRMILACRNEPRTAQVRGLTARERSVAEYAALGHSSKYIAYELGLSPPTVSTILSTVLRKLGLRSRAHLIETFATVR